MRAFYLIGEPGSGKSTLIKALTEGIEFEVRKKPFAHQVYYRDGKVIAIQLGAPHPTFPGTDRLSMAVGPVAERFVREAPAPMVFGEGDRLATRGFLSALSDAAPSTLVVYLRVPPEVAAARRSGRGPQSASWVLGRQTKVTKLAAWSAENLQLVTLEMANVTEQVEAIRTFPQVRGLYLP